MVDKKLGGAGLRGQSAGETALCTVGMSGTGLTYRGYDITDLAQHSTYEEIAYLLLYDKLPDTTELVEFKHRILASTNLPNELLQTLELLPPTTHPMDVLRTGISLLGNFEPETDFSQQDYNAERLLGACPSIVNYWYNYSHNNRRTDVSSPARSLAEHFLTTLHGREPDGLHARVMDVSLILYAEHEFNASTFTARVCASTLSDFHSCITAAIGSLRGPLHGGANEAAMAMLERFDSPEHAVQQVKQMLTRKELIMGFGHAVYREFDPRNEIIKSWAEKLANQNGDTSWFELACAVEQTMKDEKKLFANADFFHAPAYRYMDIPTKLFTPIFVCSRVAGWAAHIKEQRSNNRIIRPSATYVGSDPRPYIALEDR